MLGEADWLGGEHVASYQVCELFGGNSKIRGEACWRIGRSFRCWVGWYGFMARCSVDWCDIIEKWARFVAWQVGINACGNLQVDMITKVKQNDELIWLNASGMFWVGGTGLHHVVLWDWGWCMLMSNGKSGWQGVISSSSEVVWVWEVIGESGWMCSFKLGAWWLLVLMS